MLIPPRASKTLEKSDCRPPPNMMAAWSAAAALTTDAWISVSILALMSDSSPRMDVWFSSDCS